METNLFSSAGPGPAKRDFLIVALMAGVVFCIAHLHGLRSSFVLNDDARQQIYWMQSFVDPGLYPPDLQGDYARLYVPYALKALYKVVSPFIGPLFFSKILTGLLYVVLAGAMFCIGFRIFGKKGGYITALTTLCLPWFLYNMSGGLARSFVPPLMAIFMAAWLYERPKLMAGTLLAAAIFIPYLFLILAGAVLLSFVQGMIFKNLPKPPFPKGALHLAIIAVGGLLVYSFNASIESAGFGPLVSISDMEGQSIFGPQGRLNIYPLPSIFHEAVYAPLERVGLFRELGLWPGILSLAAIILLAGAGIWQAVRKGVFRAWAKRGELAALLSPFLYLLAASLFLYLLARVIALRLFVPERYLVYSLYLLYTLLIAFGIGQLILAAKFRTPVLVILTLAALAFGGLRQIDLGLYDYSADQELYAEARKTPKNAILAGHPELMDNVLTFGRRNVYLSFELLHPWSKGYWEEVAPRLENLLGAYYAKDPNIVRLFAQRRRISYFVVDERHFSRDFLENRPMFAPYDKFIRNLAEKPGKFALLNRDIFPGIKAGDGQWIVPIEKMSLP